jgi:hypothetical protein
VSRTPALTPVHVDQMLRDSRKRVTMVLTLTWALTLITGAIGFATAPKALSLAFLVLVVGCAMAAIRPAFGVYLLVFFTLVGDAETMPWWPFTKNMSSEESIFYVSDALSVTPLEIVLGVTFLSFLVRSVADDSWRVRRARLFWPMAIFAAFVALGFVRGVFGGGDRPIAIIEARPLLYLPVVYVLVTNLILKPEQYRRLFFAAMVAIGIQSVFSLNFYLHLSEEKKRNLETLSEHSATVHMNTLFLLMLALLLFDGTKTKRRWLALLAVPVVVAYLLSQRRAAMVAMVVGLVLLFGVLFHRRRRIFWLVTPAGVVMSLAFVLATWNAGGAIGMPATAVKSVLFPDQLSEEDLISNIYRDLEAFNLWVTVRSDPIRGFGFGHKFIVAAPMPDISKFFPDWQYIPHNSTMWVWIKTGFFGFAAMLVWIARGVQLGARAAVRIVSADDAAMVVAALGYVAMFAVFNYVDIGWSIRPAVFLALCLALCCDFERVAETRDPAPDDGVGRRVVRPALVSARAA